MSTENGFSEWGGYMAAKITKLDEQFLAASEPFRKTSLFSGVSIFVNGHTSPSADELKRIMMTHGGIYHTYQQTHTSFMIASNLPDVKVRNMNTGRIISAQWVVDCVRENRILDYSHYLLYTNQNKTQQCLQFVSKAKEENVEANDGAATANAASSNVPDLSVDAAIEEIKKGLEQLNANMGQNSNSRATKMVEEPPKASSSSAPRTAKDPRFLSEFYNNSRLHHIATLGTGFKDYVTDLRELHAVSAQEDFPAHAILMQRLQDQGIVKEPYVKSVTSLVMHIDMDCFFVSVGLRSYPHLRGKPVAVTHSKGGAAATSVPVHAGANRQLEMELYAKRFSEEQHNEVLTDKVRNGFGGQMSLSEISSCSYEARAKGVRNGMFVGNALKLCPELQTIPYDFDNYKKVAYTLYDTIAQYTLNIEAVSCDEMFVDITSVLDSLQLSVMDFVAAVRAEVREKTGCPCSAGVGANKLQARLATKRAKPDGQYWLLAADVLSYIADLPIRELPGVGSITEHTLSGLQLRTCGDLQTYSLVPLQAALGKKMGETVFEFANGIDRRPMQYGQIRKSVSAEINYGIRFAENTELEAFLNLLSCEVQMRLTNIKRKTKSVVLKVMVRADNAPIEASKYMGHGVCQTITKTVPLSYYTDDLDVISRSVLSAMKSLSLPPNELRGIGIHLMKLDEPVQVNKPKSNAIMTMYKKLEVKQKRQPLDFITTVTAVKRTIGGNASTSKHQSVNILAANKKSNRFSPYEKPKESNKVKNDPTVFDLLQAGAIEKRRQANQTAGIELPSDFDPNVFFSLPEAIRIDVLRERNLLPNAPPAKAENQYDSDLDMEPCTSREALERQRRRDAAKASKPEMTQNQLLQLDVFGALLDDLELSNNAENEQPQPDAIDATIPAIQETQLPAAKQSENLFTQPNTKILLALWVKKYATPQAYDVKWVCHNAIIMVQMGMTDSLYSSLYFLSRLLKALRGPLVESSCDWHAAYNLIVNTVQNEVDRTTGCFLFYKSLQIICDKCSR